MKIRVATLLAGLLVPTAAGARPVRPERWSAGASIGVEAEPDSIGDGLEATPLYGVAGTVRFHRFACLDSRFGIGASEDGSETTRVAETRLRFDLRAALCRAVHRAVTFVVGIGPALGLSLLGVRVEDQTVARTGVDLGGSFDGGVLLRIPPIVLRVDLELVLLARLALGMFFSAGVAL